MICGIIHRYEQGEANPVAVGGPLRWLRRLLRLIIDGTALDELLCFDAVQSREPFAELLYRRDLRRRIPLSTNGRNHCSNGYIRRAGHAPSFERSAQRSNGNAPRVRNSLLLTTR